MNDVCKALFDVEDKWFVATDASRGPWQADACHGGPVAALLARTLEHALPEKQLVRATIEFRRPIPMSGVRAEGSVVSEGRTVSYASAALAGRDGKTCATASGLFMTPGDFGAFPTPVVDGPSFDPSRLGEFPVQTALHGQVFFGNVIDVVIPEDESDGHGPGAMWMRTLPLLEHEEPSPFQIACPISDCGNAISRNAGFDVAKFINPDITIALHRLPVSRWLASRAVSHWQPNGVGLSEATLYDKFGPIGMALQTLIVRPAGD
jgi:acyl-coenzyme A thioesterase PaaI-like protein